MTVQVWIAGAGMFEEVHGRRDGTAGCSTECVAMIDRLGRSPHVKLT